MKTGLVLQGIDAPDDFVELVDFAEKAGYDHLWLTDSSLHSAAAGRTSPWRRCGPNGSCWARR